MTACLTNSQQDIDGGGDSKHAARDFGSRERVSYWAFNPDQSNYVTQGPLELSYFPLPPFIAPLGGRLWL